jgi:hypothetical protein
MDTKDLRKGNWLVMKDGKEERCVQVAHINGSRINDLDHTRFKPKPIKLDVLRQVGFSEESHADELEMTFLKFTVGDIPHYKLRAQKEEGGGYRVSLFLGEHQLWPWVNSVHELQNYFFVQSGQELELTF